MLTIISNMEVSADISQKRVSFEIDRLTCLIEVDDPGIRGLMIRVLGPMLQCTNGQELPGWRKNSAGTSGSCDTDPWILPR